MTRLKHARYFMFIGLLITSAPVIVSFVPLNLALPLAFDVAALGFMVSCIGMWRAGESDLLRLQAARDDGGRALLLAFTGLILVAVFGALGVLLDGSSRVSLADASLMAGTIVIAWLFGNLVYAFHYAHMYYDAAKFDQPVAEHRGGLQFPENTTPCFADFVNFSFVIGMTCQTADVLITSAWMRRTSTVHSVLSFFFNLIVLALVVNVVASMVRGA